MIGEEWRDVPSAPGLLASSEGRIMSIPRRQEQHRGTRLYGGQPQFGSWSRKNARFYLTYLGRTYTVARLICEAFHGPPPFDDAMALHLDENAANNRAANLKWGTCKENMNFPDFLEYCRSRTGDDNPRRKAVLRKRETVKTVALAST
jgi:hypothetical protein